MGNQNKSFTKSCTKASRMTMTLWIPRTPARPHIPPWLTWDKPFWTHTSGQGYRLHGGWWDLAQRWTRCHCLRAQRPGSTPSSLGRFATCFGRHPDQGPAEEEKSSSQGLHVPRPSLTTITAQSTGTGKKQQWASVVGRKSITVSEQSLKMIVGHPRQEDWHSTSWCCNKNA